MPQGAGWLAVVPETNWRPAFQSVLEWKSRPLLGRILLPVVRASLVLPLQPWAQPVGQGVRPRAKRTQTSHLLRKTKTRKLGESFFRSYPPDRGELACLVPDM